MDERDGVSVEYSARGVPSSLRDTLEGGLVGFEVPALEATSGSLVLRADASEVRYLSLGTLAGALEYVVDGPGLSLRVTSDFGEGSSYPDVRWSCP